MVVRSAECPRSAAGEHREHTAADANGFGLGSALYKPGMDVAQRKANALEFEAGLARDHRAG
jgi:hypothetical protein